MSRKRSPYVEERLAAIAKAATGSKRGYVYFATDDGENVKIGFSTNVGSRMSSLSTGNVKKVRVIERIHTYIEAEKILHLHFEREWLKGEWFKFSSRLEDFLEDVWDCKAGLAIKTVGVNVSGIEFMATAEHAFFELAILNRLLSLEEADAWPDNFP